MIGHIDIEATIKFISFGLLMLYEPMEPSILCVVAGSDLIPTQIHVQFFVEGGMGVAGR